MTDPAPLLVAAFQSLLVATWHASLLVLALLVLLRLTRRHLEPRHRHALWLVVVVRLLLPVLPGTPLSLLNWCGLPLATPAAQQLRDVSAADAQWRIAVTTGRDTTLPATTVTTAAASGPPARNASPYAALWLAAAILWCVGACAAVALPLARYVRYALRLRRAAPLVDPALAALVESCSRRLRLRRRVPLALAPGLAGPAVRGVWRPQLLLPPHVLAHCSLGQLRMILLHELAHVRRRDVAVHWLGTLARALHWFNPLLWYALRRMQTERELACDRLVLSLVPAARRLDYGRTLLHVLELSPPAAGLPAGMAGLVFMFDRRNALQERISMIARTSSRRPLSRLVTPLLLALLAAVGLTDAAEPPAPLPPEPAPPAAIIHGYELPPGRILPAPERIAADDAWPARPAVPHAPPTHVPGGEPLVITYAVGDLIELFEKHDRLVGPGAAAQSLAQWLTASGDLCRCPDCVRGVVPYPADAPSGLVVRAPREAHDRVAAEIDRLRAYGLDQIVITTRIATIPQTDIDVLPIDWSMLLSTHAEPQDAQPTEFVSARFSRGVPSPALGNQGLVGAGTLTTSRQFPVLYSISSAERTLQVIKALQSHARANILAAPKVTVFNGQTATVETATHRPFVVGHAGGQPQIEVIAEGTQMRLHPVLDSARGTIRLGGTITLSEITKVETFISPVDFRTGDGNTRITAERLTLQVPEVATRQVQVAADLAPGQTLILGGLTTTSPEGRPTALLILLETALFEFPED